MSFSDLSFVSRWFWTLQQLVRKSNGDDLILARIRDLTSWFENLGASRCHLHVLTLQGIASELLLFRNRCRPPNLPLGEQVMDSSIENRFLMSQWTSIPWYGFYRNRGFKNSITHLNLGDEYEMDSDEDDPLGNNMFQEPQGITHLNLGDEWNGLRWGWPSRKQHVSRAPRHHTSQVRNDTIFSIC